MRQWEERGWGIKGKNFYRSFSFFWKHQNKKAVRFQNSREKYYLLNISWVKSFRRIWAYLHIFWKCVKSDCISRYKTSPKIGHLSEVNIIKAADLSVDIYVTLLEGNIHWQSFWGKMCLISSHKKRQWIQSQGVFLDWSFITLKFSKLEKCFLQV